MVRITAFLVYLLSGLFAVEGKLNSRVALNVRPSLRTSKLSKIDKIDKQSSVSPSKAEFRVVTDLDDTIKSSGGKNVFGIYLGGIDNQFKRGTFYPGAFQFAWELSKHNKVRTSLMPKVAVLTARAREFKFVLAIKPKSKVAEAFRRVGDSMGTPEWGLGDVLYGSVVEWVFGTRKAKRKFDNFGILMAKDDSINANNRQKYVLVGDTGERDEAAGERIIRAHPNRIKAIFLHKVENTPDHSHIKLPKDRKYHGVPIFYFRTYVGAAHKAVGANLISYGGLSRVMNAAKRELKTIDPPPSGRKIGSSSRWMDLYKDCDAIKQNTMERLVTLMMASGSR
jgi:hypothetical protein